ncbi:MAG: GNAT family N-acetyltransferase [Propionibacteriaceae bacterium]
MITPADLWPPFGLVVTAGDLTLTPVTDDDLPALVDLVLDGVHPATEMPFDVPWTRTPVADLPRELARYHWRCRAETSPAHLDLNLTVRRHDEILGSQGCHLNDFAVTRTAETGSWLALRHQGQGLGTRMRRAVCSLLFDHLGASQVSSTAFVDNPASLAVSRKVGYVTDGVQRRNREGVLAESQRLVLTPEAFVRGEQVKVSRAEPLWRYLHQG